MTTNDRAPSAGEGPPAEGGHRELIETALIVHIKLGGDTGHWCLACSSPWPCLTVRLATALEQETAALSAEVEAHCDYVAETTTAALRLVAERDAACEAITTYVEALSAAERRAAEALEATTAEAALHDLARQERDAAERRVAELERQLRTAMTEWGNVHQADLAQLATLADALAAALEDARAYRDRYSRELARNGEIYEQNKDDRAELLTRAFAAERRVAEETERAEVAEAGLHRYAELYEASHAALLARQAATEKQEPARHPSDCECYPCWQRSER